MKNWPILVWYSAFVIILLTFDSDPGSFVIGVLFSMLVIPLSIVNLILTTFQWFRHRWKWKGILALFIFMVSLYQLSRIYSIHTANEEGEFRLLTYNASFFRIPTVYSDAYFHPQKPTINDQMVDWIVAQKCDFLFIQEFFNDEKSEDFNNLRVLMERGGYTDYFYINAPRHDNGTSRGLIIFSKNPILEKRQLFLGENRFNGAEEVITTWNGDTIRLVNVHLKSSAFELRKNMKSLGGMKQEVKKFFNDGALKAHQINLVLEKLADRSYPTIIAGDFNSTRFSYVYSEMNRHYNNAFESAGHGFGFTLLGWFRMPLKLDHQFYNNGLECRSIEVVNSEARSDHFPLLATYSLK